MSDTPLLEIKNVSKYYGNIIALRDITTSVRAGAVTCVLGDNGAGKSTFIKILAGAHQQSEGQLFVEGQEVMFDSPRDALARGIATVYQDLAMVPLMSVWRNFFLGAEPTRRLGPIKVIDKEKAALIAKEEMGKMGIDIRDTEQSVGTLSGGERQSVAIARAAYFGAKVLILDEPTSALGVKQSGVVLRYIVEARNRGLGVIFITHNPNHAWPVGDRFMILNRGQSLGDFAKDELTQAELTQLMAGGAELEALQHELSQAVASGDADEHLREVAEDVAEELQDLGERVSRRTDAGSLYASMVEAGQAPSTRVIRCETVPAEGDVAADLGVQAGTPVLAVERVRLSAGRPFALLRNWLTVGTGGEITTAQLESGSLYDRLASLGVEPGPASLSQGAKAADRSEAEALSLSEGDPLVTVVRVMRDRNGRIIELGRHLYDAEQYTLESTVGDSE